MADMKEQSPRAPHHGGVTLSARQLRKALEFVAPDFDTDEDQREALVSIAFGEAGATTDDGEAPDPAGYRVWMTEYPEEGSVLLTDEDPGDMPDLTDAEIDRIADAMPGGLQGFSKGWGWRQFARRVLAARPKWQLAPPVTAPLRQAREEAELYRWLRPRLLAADFNWNGEGVQVVVFRWPENASIGADLDASIKAAREFERAGRG